MASHWYLSEKPPIDLDSTTDYKKDSHSLFKQLINSIECAHNLAYYHAIINTHLNFLVSP